MILIADSGSTKTDWLIPSGINNTYKICTTKGINPFHQNSTEILNLLLEEFDWPTEGIHHIYFYGAGCANEEKNQIVKDALKKFIPHASISVYSDLLGAAHALCGIEKGIVCILGTGSNSCFYDGERILKNVSPLGYIIGDEGSGAVLGKILVADVLKNQLPEQIIQLFFNEHNTSKDEILDHIYKQPFVNRYLAQYTKFIYRHIENQYLESLVIQSFDAFIKRNLLQYENIENYKINFTGSIAYYFKEQLIKVLKQHKLSPGKIYQSPKDGLIEYYSQQ